MKVVVLKLLGGNRVATHVRHFAVKAGRRKWATSSRFYNPVTGGFDVVTADRSPYRTKKAAERAARRFDRHMFPWNWWMVTLGYARRKARESGVIVRVMKEREKNVSK